MISNSGNSRILHPDSASLSVFAVSTSTGDPAQTRKSTFVGVHCGNFLRRPSKIDTDSPSPLSVKESPLACHTTRQIISFLRWFTCEEFSFLLDIPCGITRRSISRLAAASTSAFKFRGMAGADSASSPSLSSLRPLWRRLPALGGPVVTPDPESPSTARRFRAAAPLSRPRSSKNRMSLRKWRSENSFIPTKAVRFRFPSQDNFSL
mmetsp:Transcript_9086/g.17916  ORF Transcript_9086/g.17916 Transcript_9086/m.17916 type:complete len:207 (-) Transcript_9086:3153-3773(-)